MIFWYSLLKISVLALLVCLAILMFLLMMAMISLGARK